jgi:hypothetical protein
MNTLTVELPESVDPAYARWEMARTLYEKGKITLEEAAKLVDLSPIYFKIRLEKPFDWAAFQAKQNLLASSKPFDRQRFDQLVAQLDIKESFNELVAMIGK